MPRFLYRATDAAGAHCEGSVEAADMVAAKAELTARMLSVETITPQQPPFAGAAEALSAAEANQLALHLVELTKAGVPLGSGLESLAAELPDGRLARTLSRIGKQLALGMPVDMAVEAATRKLPAHVRGLLAAGMQSGRVDEVLEQLLFEQRRSQEVSREVRSALAYPLLLLAILLAWFLFMVDYVAPRIGSIFDDFGSELPEPSALLVRLGAIKLSPLVIAVAVGVCVALVLVRAIGGRAVLSQFYNDVPLVGSLRRYRNLAQCTSLLALLLRQGLPLPAALRLGASGMRDAALAKACSDSAHSVEDGVLLSRAAAALPAFPITLQPLLQWGERTSAMPEALDMAAGYFRRRVEQHATMLARVLPPLVLLTIAATASFFVIALYGPLVNLIQDLNDMSWFTGVPKVRYTIALPMNPIVAGSIMCLIACGLTLLLTVRLVYRRGPNRRSLWHAAQRGTGFTCLILALLLLLGAALGVATVLIAIFAAMVWAMTAMQYRASQRGALLDWMALAIEKQIPLPQAITAFAHECHGRFGWHVDQLARRLESGEPLAHAVDQPPRVLPRGAALAITLGTETGDVGEALRDLSVRLALRPPIWRGPLSRFSYLACFTLIFIPALILFMTFNLTPQLQKIFWDFGSDLPQMTQILMRWTGQPWMVMLLAATLFVGVALLVVSAISYVAGLPIYLPGTEWLFKRLDTSLILRALSLGAARQRPLGGLLDALISTHPKQRIRRRLKRARAEITEGMPWTDSLQNQGVIGRADAAVLNAAQRVGNLPWALEEMAQSNERRLLYRIQLFVAIGFPMCVVAIGMLVAFCVVGYFLPLVKLITDLSG